MHAFGMHLDSSMSSGYWRVTDDGLFQIGHSKDHRPALLEVKGILSVLAPLRLPEATDVIPGQQADDPLSLLAITRVQQEGGQLGLLCVGMPR
jgi:transposase